MKRLLFLVISVICLISACNTVRGVGEDVEAVGGVVQEAADQ